MVKTLEIREYGRGQGNERDNIDTIEIGIHPAPLLEAPGSPVVKEKGENVQLEFRKNVLVIERGQLALSPVEIPLGKSVNIRPFNFPTEPSAIPEANVAHIKTEKRKTPSLTSKQNQEID